MSDELGLGDENLSSSKFKVLVLAVLLVVLGLIFLGFGAAATLFSPPITVSPTPEATPQPESSVLSSEGQEVSVARVVDGDTIELETGQSVRYIGIDTPETVDPRRPVGCFGKEASDENKRLVGGKAVLLVKDVSDTDRFGRLLRYVYIRQDGSLLFINDHLVRQGFAKASTYPPDVKFTEQFLQAEREAREAGRGLWSRCS